MLDYYVNQLLGNEWRPIILLNAAILKMNNRPEKGWELGSNVNYTQALTYSA